MIARGAEAGGHGEPTVGTLPLLAAIPAITYRCGCRLAAGASGAWLGTAFCART